MTPRRILPGQADDQVTYLVADTRTTGPIRLRHIACELACNTWSDRATVILSGFGDEADTVTEIGPDRIVIADSASSAITTVRAELARRAASGATAPATLLLVGSPDASTRTALAELHQDLANTGRCGIAVVTTAARLAPPFSLSLKPDNFEPTWPACG